MNTLLRSIVPHGNCLDSDYFRNWYDQSRIIARAEFHKIRPLLFSFRQPHNKLNP